MSLSKAVEGMTSALKSVALAAALLTLAAQTVEAQDSWSLEFRGGMAVPAGDLADVGDPGAGFGLGLGIPIGSRLNFRIDGDVELLSEDLVGAYPGVIMPKSQLYHAHAGLELDLLSGDGWQFAIRGGAGATIFDTDPFASSGDDFLDTYFSVNGGVRLGRMIGSSMELGLLGQAFIVYTDEARTAEFAAEDPVIPAFPAASSFPLGLYLRWSPN
jgi:hypothetical protein